eukprot:755642-Hanusia_phi.AAC.4
MFSAQSDMYIDPLDMRGQKWLILATSEEMSPSDVLSESSSSSSLLGPAFTPNSRESLWRRSNKFLLSVTSLRVVRRTSGSPLVPDLRIATSHVGYLLPKLLPAPRESRQQQLELEKSQSSLQIQSHARPRRQFLQTLRQRISREISGNHELP